MNLENVHNIEDFIDYLVSKTPQELANEIGDGVVHNFSEISKDWEDLNQNDSKKSL